MKKILLSVAVVAAAAAALSAKAPKDPVVMTIDGNDVYLSEFEYLYNKNNSQQLEPMSFDDYVELFINYKLKVADAKASGYDTTATFRHEFGKYRRELARPYLRDAATEEALVQEAYGHTKEDVYVSHIMLDLRNPKAQALADSLYEGITNGSLVYEDEAAAHSIDKGSAIKGGDMGWVTGNGRFPWAFEKAAYDTPVGQVSRPVNSGFGLHLVRVEKRRPAVGEVHTRHILLTTRGVDSTLVAERKARIDSIYSEVTKPGADFGDFAARFSMDPGSRENGGDLGWYGPGMMVEPFDSISFAMSVGEISKPFATPYGYHIIQKLEARQSQPLDEMRPAILEAMEQDGRAQLPVQAMIDRTAAATNSYIVDDYKDEIRRIVRNVGGMSDTTALKQIKASEVTAYVFKGQPVSMATVIGGQGLLLGAPADVLINNVDRMVKESFDNEITEVEMAELERTNPEFRNIITEYRDGIMLFDVANAKVWDRASKDKAGLEEYFQSHRDKYTTWTAPRYRAYVVFTSDSLDNAKVKAFVDSAYAGATIATINQEEFTRNLRDNFKQQVRIERVIAAKGDNAITDYLGFGAEKPAPGSSSWRYYFPVAGEIIEQPVEALDVKAAVVTDYQTQLEKDWVDELRRTHKVTVNKKNLKKADK